MCSDLSQRVKIFTAYLCSQMHFKSSPCCENDHVLMHDCGTGYIFEECAVIRNRRTKVAENVISIYIFYLYFDHNVFFAFLSSQFTKREHKNIIDHNKISFSVQPPADISFFLTVFTLHSRSKSLAQMCTMSASHFFAKH